MINCDRRQREVKRERDGTETEQHRCIEKKADTYLEIVDIPTCEGCPILAMKNEIRGCSGVAEPEPAWASELLSSKIVSRETGAVVHDAEKELGFEKACPYRLNMKCAITGHKITPEICKRCDQETAEEMATLPKKMVNYANAIKRWIREGRPTRTDEEVAERLDICQGNEEKGIPRCNLYDEDSHACKKCGCAVSDAKAPLKNKLRMKTEVCPMGHWK